MVLWNTQRGPNARQANGVGRRVAVRVEVAQAINDVAFWTGAAPHQLLVVVHRGTRSGAERQRGAPSTAAMPLPSTGVVTLGGVVTDVPYAEAMYSWGLTTRDMAPLAERGVYVRADEILMLHPEVQRR